MYAKRLKNNNTNINLFCKWQSGKAESEFYQYSSSESLVLNITPSTFIPPPHNKQSYINSPSDQRCRKQWRYLTEPQDNSCCFHRTLNVTDIADKRGPGVVWYISVCMYRCLCSNQQQKQHCSFQGIHIYVMSDGPLSCHWGIALGGCRCFVIWSIFPLAHKGFSAQLISKW